MRVWGHYEGRLRDAILSLKYHKNLGMGNALSQPLIEIIRTEKWKFDLVIPVPLSAQRHFERGYNQVSQLAFPISLCLGLHYRPAGLRRIRNTASQVGLTGDQRRRNVIGAFQADHGIVGGRSVLLVDDVTTTGTTLDECSLALVSAGVKTVYAITLARAGHLPVE
jgi:ComF family protein